MNFKTPTRLVKKNTQINTNPATTLSQNPWRKTKTTNKNTIQKH